MTTEKKTSLVFPIIQDIESIRTAIKDCKNFSEKTIEDYIVFNYKFGLTDTFPDPNSAPNEQTRINYLLRRECRGLIFDKNTKKLLSRR